MTRVMTVARVALGFGLVMAGLSGSAWAVNVPEIDPGSAIGALTLLSGGVLLLTSKRRAK